jgi:hypothetical protein
MKNARATDRRFLITVATLIGCVALLMQAGCDSDPVPSNQGFKPTDSGQSYAAVQSPDNQMYANFESVAIASGIDLRSHPSYTQQYVVGRAHSFCSLMANGDLTKLTSEITFPPVQSLFETTQDRSRLEAIILKTGTPAYCPDYDVTANQWLVTNTTSVR